MSTRAVFVRRWLAAATLSALFAGIAMPGALADQPDLSLDHDGDGLITGVGLSDGDEVHVYGANRGGAA